LEDEKMKKYAYGVDIGGTTVKMGFFETTGKLVDTWEIPTRTENSGELILPDITASSRRITRSMVSRWVTSRA